MASFTTRSEIEALMSHRGHTATSVPSIAQLEAQMELDASRVRGWLSNAGFPGDPTPGSRLEGLCRQANTLLSAAYGIGMQENLKPTDMELQRTYLKSAQGSDGAGGLRLEIEELAATLAPTSGGPSTTSVSSPERSVADLIHWDMQT